MIQSLRGWQKRKVLKKAHLTLAVCGRVGAYPASIFRRCRVELLWSETKKFNTKPSAKNQT